MRDQTAWSVAGIISILGVVLSGLHLWHAINEVAKNLPAMVYGSVLPLFLSLLITGSGYWIMQRDWSAVSPLRIARWSGGGLVTGVVASGLLIRYQAAEGVNVSDPFFVLGMFGTYGVALGLLLGRYDVQKHAQKRRHEQQALKLDQSNTVLWTVVENLPMGVLVEDAERNILIANDQLGETLGVPLTGDDLIGRDCDAAAEELKDLFADSDAFVEGINERIAEREEAHEELALADGRTLERYYVPYTLPDGKAHLWLYRDITERKQRQKTLKRQNTRLDEFTSTVSHDLRNPLHIASASLALARGECDSEHLNRVERAHDKMEALIEDLLRLAREGESVTDFEPVDLASIAEDSWANVETSNATINIDIDQTIEADKRRLKQVFENLFRNAVEHGGESVTVGERPGGFYVEDDGPGIPAENRPDVFEAGYSTSEEGTGFGLSIVKRVVEAHDWNIRITESESGGARFEISGVEVATD